MQEEVKKIESHYKKELKKKDTKYEVLVDEYEKLKTTERDYQKKIRKLEEAVGDMEDEVMSLKRNSSSKKTTSISPSLPKKNGHSRQLSGSARFDPTAYQIFL